MRLLTMRQVCSLLGISVATAYRLQSRGEFPPSIKIGASKRWVESVIGAWIEERCPALGNPQR